MAVSTLYSNVRVTGSAVMLNPNFTGAGGVTIFRSGDFVLISGGVGTGGSAISSGGTANISGLISTGQADLRYYPLLSNPSGYITTGQTGQFYLASNPLGFATSGNLASTGQNAVNYTDSRVAATGLANVNYTDARIGATGQQAWISSQNNALNLSGALNASGRRAWNDAINLSGNLLLTGQKTWLFETTLSGNVTITGQSLLTTIASTGQQAWSAAQNNALNLSGNLNASGRRAWDDAINLSGNLQSTGQKNWLFGLKVSGDLTATGALITTISGWTDSFYVHRFGNESITGNKTFINETIFNENITGKKATFSINTLPLPAPTTSLGTALLHIASQDGDGSQIMIDSFDYIPALNFRRANGTNSSKSNLQNSNQIGSISAYGYGSSAYSIDPNAAIRFRSQGNWTDTQRGTFIEIYTTPLENQTLLNIARFSSSGITTPIKIGVGTETPREALDINGNCFLRSGQYNSAVIISSNYSISLNDSKLYCNNTNPITLTFPSVAGSSGQLISIKLLNTGAVYFTGTFGQKFDGSDLYVAAGQYNTYSLHAFANNWNLW